MLGWTVIYSTKADGVGSFSMMAEHDGSAAWETAAKKLRVRLGPGEIFTLLACVKGMNPTYVKNRKKSK